MPDQCPSCEGFDIGFLGLGTERITDQVQRRFPDVSVLRMDRDTVASSGAYTRILQQFARGEAQILIGTQMIAKGHDFPAVTMVGVINADVGLHRPDFRASERSFQILTQVAGRAGRADKPGEVYVQTYNPDHEALLAAADHDYARFYGREILHRRDNEYPPFAALANLVLSHPQETSALQAARTIAQHLQALGVNHGRGLPSFLGPASCPLQRLRGRYRFQVLLKAPSYADLGNLLRPLQEKLDLSAEFRLTVDVDPHDMM
jgi:primosomal protein N' (replication factor Y)